MDELQKYYEYLKQHGADVPPSIESFKNTLSDETSARRYYQYLKDNKFDAPETFDSFSNTFGLKKKDVGNNVSPLSNVGTMAGNTGSETQSTGSQKDYNLKPVHQNISESTVPQNHQTDFQIQHQVEVNRAQQTGSFASINNLKSEGIDTDNLNSQQVRQLNPQNLPQRIALDKVAKLKTYQEHPFADASLINANPQLADANNKDYQTPFQFRDKNNAKAGSDILHALNDPDVIEMAQQDPKMAQQYKDAQANLYQDYPKLAMGQIATKISQYREHKGDNSYILNNVSEKNIDRYVDEMSKLPANDQYHMTPSEVTAYKQTVLPALRSHEAEIKTTGFLESLGEGTRSGINDIGKTLRNTLNTVTFGLPQKAGLIESDSDRQKRLVNDQYTMSTVTPEHAGTVLSSGLGNFSGYMIPMIATGSILKGLGLSEIPANRLSNYLMFEGNNSEKALQDHPDNKLAQVLQTGITTLGDIYLMEKLPANKISTDIRNSFRNEVKDVAENLATNNITAAEAKTTLLNKFGNVLKKTAQGNIEAANIMTADNAFHQGVNSLLGTGNKSEQDALNEDLQTWKTAFLGSTILSGVHALSNTSPKIQGNILREISENPEKYKPIIENSNATPEAKADLLQNLNDAVNISNDLKGKEDLTQPQKDKLLITELQKRIAQRQLGSTSTEALQKEPLEKIDEANKTQQNILSGKDNATEHQTVSDNEIDKIKPTLTSDQSILKDAVDNGEIKGMNAEMAKEAIKNSDNSTDFLKSVADQVNNANNESGLFTDEQAIKKAKEDFGENVVKLATKRFPKNETPIQEAGTNNQQGNISTEEKKPTEASVSQDVQQPEKSDFDHFKEQMLSELEGRSKDKFDLKINHELLPVEQKTIEQGIKNIREGKDTKAAQQVEAAIKKMYDDGVVHYEAKSGKIHTQQPQGIPASHFIDISKEANKPIDINNDDHLHELNMLLGEDAFPHVVNEENANFKNQTDESTSKNDTGEGTIQQPTKGQAAESNPKVTGNEGGIPPQQPNATEPTAADNEGNTVGISHDELSKLAEKLGLPKIERGTHLSPEEYADRGRKLLDGGADVYKVEKEFKDGKQPSADDISIARAHLEDLEKQRNKIGDIKGTNNDEYKNAEKEVDRWARDVVKPMGTKASEPFTALQGSRDLDTGSFTAIKNAKANVDGKPVGDLPSSIKELSEKVKSISEENEKLQQKLRDFLDKTTNQEAKDKSKKYSEAAKKAANVFRRLKTKPFKFKDENGNDVDTTKMGITWNGLVELGAKAIEKTGEIADGISAIIDKIKDTDFYAKLSDNGKKEFERQLSEHYKNQLENTPEAKNIRRLEKQLSDLQEGKAKNATDKRESSQREKELQDKIFDEKSKLGLIKSKSEKPDEQQLSEQENLENLASRFADKNDNKFTPQDSKDIWEYAKKTYIDNNSDFKVPDMVNKVAMDLGLKPEQIRHALAVSPETKKVTNQIYRNQYEKNKANETIKRWVNKSKESVVDNLFNTIAAPFRGLATLGHGHALLFTHAAPNLFDPVVAKKFFMLAGKQFKIVYGNEAYYEKAKSDLRGDPLFTPALRAGVGVDPSTVYDDWQLANNFLKKLKIQGNKGFLILKMMRMEIFKAHYNRLSDIEKADDATMKAVGQLTNHWTGTAGLKVSASANAFIFAPNLIASKFARLTTDPIKAIATYSKLGVNKIGGNIDVSTADKAAARIIVQKSGRILGMYLAALAGNQGLLLATGSNQSINFLNPFKSDWLKFKAGDKTVDLSGGLESTFSFLTKLAALPFEGKDQIKQNYYGANSPQDAAKGLLWSEARSIASPFGSTALDLATHTDFQGNVLPFFNDKPRSGKEKLSLLNYAMEKAPIPLADAWRTVGDQMKEEGVSAPTVKNVLNGLLITAVASSGIKMGNEPNQRPTPFNDEDKKDPTFKYFLDKGMELPNTSLSSEKITDNENSTQKKISEYPKEIQDKYSNTHKEFLKEELQKTLDKGVYVKTYKDANGKSISEVSLNRPKGDYEEKDVSNLSKDELTQVLHLTQSQATTKAKKEVFSH